MNSHPASANPAIFNNADGSARTVSEVYANLTSLPEVQATATGRASVTPDAPVRAPAIDAVTSMAGSAARPTSSFASVGFAPQSAPGSYTSLLTPQVMEILSSLDPAAAFGSDDDDDRSNLMRNV